MPRLNGYQLHQRVIGNPRWVAIPLLFLTARAMDSDIRYGKELGVDDYLTKPVEPEDLLAAVQGRLRRMECLARSRPRNAAEPLEGPDVLDFGNLRIAPSQFRIWRHGSRVELSVREFRLLECLAKRAGRVVPVRELIKASHGLDADPAEAGSLVRPMIRSLRRKLGYSAGDKGCIENVRGVGYQFVPQRN
jgi:DNA-binding response OmpR family regulator